MRIRDIAFTFALLGAAVPTAAMAQGKGSSALRQPASIAAASFEDPAVESVSGTGELQLISADAPKAPAVQPPSSPADVPPKLDGQAAPPIEYAPPPDAAPAGPTPWKLPQPSFLQSRGVEIGGWLQQGITFNADHPADGFNGPVTTNDLDRQYQMNQFWLYMVRPTKTDGCGWDLGGRFDMVYGTDWRFGQCFGLEDQIDGSNSFYGLVLPQFYMEAAVNNLTVKMGHFATATSYELVPAPANFFYSHTYMMAGYFDPLLVTGMLASYKLNDNWSVNSGFHRGWNMFEDLNHDLDYLGGINWVSDDKRSTFAMSIDTGAQDPAGVQQRTILMFIETRQLTQKLNFAAQQTVGFENNGSGVTPGQDAEWYGMDYWLTYKLNSKWSAGARFEWIRDDDGSRVFGIGTLLGTDKGWQSPPGFAGDFCDLSFGLNWRPHPNVVLRPEIRWDWYGGAPNANTGRLPFDNGTDREQFSTAVDMVVTF